MPKEGAAGKEATAEEQPVDVSKSTEASRVEEAGGIPVGIFTETERAERHEQNVREGRIQDPPEKRNPVSEGDKLLDQQAEQLKRDRDQLKERQAEDIKRNAEAQKASESVSHPEAEKKSKSHK